VQQKISRLMRDRITPDLEEQFNKLVSPDEILRIGRLEIDLGEISEMNLDSQLPDKLITNLIKAIRDELSAVLAVRDKKMRGNRREPVAEIESLAAARITRLTRFLKTGYLDQSMAGNRSGGFIELLEDLLESDAEATVKALQSEIRHTNRMQRLIHQSTDHVLLKVLVEISGIENKQIDQARSVSEFAIQLISLNRKSKLFGNMVTYKFRFEVWKTVFDIQSSWIPGSNTENLISDLLQKLAGGNSFRNYSPGEIREQFQNIENSYRKGNAGNRFSKDWMKGLARYLREFEPETVSPENTGDQEMKKEFSEIAPISSEQSNGFVERKRAQKPENSGKSAEVRTMPDTESTAGMFVRNSGLVLLYPFIPSFFRRTGLVDGKQFIDEASKQRAIHLLQYLANGQSETPEEDLVLNKIMCGMEHDTPVIPGIDILKEETDEAENLLINVIDKWQALKNSSPGSVQATFLKRDGLIRREDQHNWKITVERKAVDVLLDKLPWGLSMFRMPWSEYFIQVEW
jgi:hypothetical protein